MKGNLTAYIAGTILAVIGSTLPASAIVTNTTSQQYPSREQQPLLLASGGDSVKGGHSTGKSPSKKAKHEKGEARRNQDQNVNPAFKQYKANGGKLSKSAWEKAGRPKK